MALSLSKTDFPRGPHIRRFVPPPNSWCARQTLVVCFSTQRRSDDVSKRQAFALAYRDGNDCRTSRTVALFCRSSCRQIRGALEEQLRTPKKDTVFPFPFGNFLPLTHHRRYGVLTCV